MTRIGSGAILAHDVDLARRGVRAQEHAGRGGVERVPHVARRVVRRHVEQLEVVFVVLDLAAAVRPGSPGRRRCRRSRAASASRGAAGRACSGRPGSVTSSAPGRRLASISAWRSASAAGAVGLFQRALGLVAALADERALFFRQLCPARPAPPSAASCAPGAPRARPPARSCRLRRSARPGPRLSACSICSIMPALPDIKRLPPQTGTGAEFPWYHPDWLSRGRAHLIPTAPLGRLVVRVTLDQRRRLIGTGAIGPAPFTRSAQERTSAGVSRVGFAVEDPNLPGGFRPRTLLRHSLCCCSIKVDYPQIGRLSRRQFRPIGQPAGTDCGYTGSTSLAEPRPCTPTSS